MLTRHRLALSLTAALAVSAALAPQALANSPQPARTSVTHLGLAAGQQPENFVLRPDGTPVLTFALTGQVAELTRRGEVRVIAQLPTPANGDTPVLHSKAFAAGIDRTRDGSLYVALSTGTADATGIWRIAPGRKPQRIVALPATALLNGLAVDERGGWLYVADSVGSTVWRAPLKGGEATAWYRSDALAPSAGFLGANGLRLHDGDVWVSNLDTGSLLRIPVGRRGAAGRAETVATGLGAVDDFAFTGRGDELLVTDIKGNRLLKVRPGRSGNAVSTVLSAANGLSNPTAVAVQDDRVTVTSAAYFTQSDPNVISLKLAR
ncbi:hypothetical protein OH807_19585 [Kitasatospora sp. NBC_01560]|uniref:hypothetical protein n=1 Tax=Kitasatospora sp. NBC_01560 TaxID=2975965 RepID=UPI00386F60FD